MRKEYEASGKTVDAAIDAACLLAGTSIDNVEIEILELGGKGLFGFGHKDARVRVIVELPDQPAAAAKPETTFGTKKSKRERFEEKNKQKQVEQIEIRPIITAEPLPEGERKQPRSGNQPRREEAPRPKQQPKQRERRPEPAATEAAEAPARRESRATEIIAGEMAEKIYADSIAFLLPIFEQMQVQPEISYQLRDGILWISLAGQNLGLLIGRRGETLNALQYLTNLAANKHRHDHVRVVIDVEGYRQSREETLAALAHKMADKAVKSGRRVELEPMNPHERRVVHIALQNDRRVDTVSHGEEPYRRVVISKKRSDRKPRHRGGRGGQPGGNRGGQQAPRAEGASAPQEEA